MPENSEFSLRHLTEIYLLSGSSGGRLLASVEEPLT